MSRCQKETDQLFEQMKYDKEEIRKMEKEHGTCIRLYQSNDLNKWKFSDDFVLEIPSHKNL